MVEERTDPNMSSRERIAIAARDEFARHGYAGARVARIAARAGVNKQLIFYYFRNKSRLYDTVSETAAELAGAPERPRAEGPPTERLKAAIAQLFGLLAERPDVLALLLEHRHRRGVASKVARRAADRLVADAQAIVSEGQGLGYFRDDIDPTHAARLVLVACAGFLGLESLLEGGPGARDAWIGEAGDVLARGLSW